MHRIFSPRLRMLSPVLLALLTVLPASCCPAADEPMKPTASTSSREGELDATLWVRDGFSISVFAALPGTLRIIAEAPTGEMVASEQWEGRVLKLADRDGDGFAEEVTPLLTGLTVAHGLAFAGNALFVAESNRVQRIEPWDDPQRPGDHPAPGADITAANHQTRS
jgi:glucose/arabinose dehydrogenase